MATNRIYEMAEPHDSLGPSRNEDDDTFSYNSNDSELFLDDDERTDTEPQVDQWDGDSNVSVVPAEIVRDSATVASALTDDASHTSKHSTRSRGKDVDKMRTHLQKRKRSASARTRKTRTGHAPADNIVKRRSKRHMTAPPSPGEVRRKSLRPRKTVRGRRI